MSKLSKTKKWLVALGLLAVAVGVVGAATQANAVEPTPALRQATITVTDTPTPYKVPAYKVLSDGSIYQAQINPYVVKMLLTNFNNSVPRAAIQPGAVDESKLSAAVLAKLNKVGTQGPAGKDGKDAIVSVTALTSLTNRPDSGLNGDWAKDTLTRTVAITKQSAVPADKCGAAATQCWFYTGSLIDTGTFTTLDGAKSPQAGTPISGVLTGTVSGGTKLEFYASSETPDPSLVQGSVDGGAYPTSTWVKQFFPAGVSVTPVGLLDWSWSYNASTICQTWTNALAGNTGDITGANACTK